MSTDNGFIKAFVNADDLKDPVIECPNCGSKDLLLEGEYYRPFQQEMKDGEEVDKVLAPEMHRRHTVINCGQCRISFRVQPPDLFDAQLKAVQAQQKLEAIENFRDLDVKHPKV